MQFALIVSFYIYPSRWPCRYRKI